MVGPFLRALAGSSFAVCLALPASAQDTVRVRGTVERIEGPVYIVKTRDGSEVKLVTTEDKPRDRAGDHEGHQARHVCRLGRHDAGGRHAEGHRGAHLSGIDARYRGRPL